MRYNRRFFGALFLTSLLTLLFMGLAVTSGAMAQHENQSGSGKSVQSAPAHETEIEATETEHSGGGGGGHTRTPEPTETEHHEATRTRTPEAEPSETEEPDETEEPHHTRTPEPTETEHGNPSRTRTPEATETEHPGETETPEATETEHPEVTRTRTPEVEPSETEHPHETRTPQPTRTGVPSPIPTGQAPATSGQPGSAASVPGTGNRTFAATGKTVNGVFLSYWDKNGGLTQQGYPISGVMQEKSSLDGKIYTTQYFERSVFELHPENAAPYNVLLSQLGTFQYKQKYPNGAPGQVANKTGGQYFAETGHWVGGAFLAYWQSHGGVAQQGFPLSDEFTEVSPLNGKSYKVQYFERAVFEFHPENAAPNNVLLSLLGAFRYKDVYQK